MSKARITYRFEHTQRSAEPDEDKKLAFSPPSADEHIEFQLSDEPVVVVEKEPRAAKPVSARRIDPPYPYDYGAWNDPAAEEISEIERIIKTTATPEAEDDAESHRRRRRFRADGMDRLDHFDRLDRMEQLDDEDYAFGPETGSWTWHGRKQGERAPVSVRRRPREKDTSWWKVIGAVAGAIATGVLFGAFVLNFFTGENGTDELTGLIQPNQPGPVADTSQSASAGAALTDPEQAMEPAAAAVAAAIDLPERRMFLLQNGMFETLESARALAADMKGKGLAATIEEGERFYVYAGVMSDRDAALRAGVELQAAGIEVYVKPYDLPNVTQVSLNDDTAQALSEYIAKGSALVQMIGDVTLVHLEGETPVAPDGATLEKLKAEHLALSERSAEASPGLPAAAVPMLKRMDDAVRNAVMAIGEYGEHPDHSYLWSAQSALMDYVIAEKQLLTAISL